MLARRASLSAGADKIEGAGDGAHLQLEDNETAFGELHGIADEVEDPANAVDVSFEVGGNGFIEGSSEEQILLPGRGRDEALDFIEKFPGRKPLGFDGKAPRHYN